MIKIWHYDTDWFVKLLMETSHFKVFLAMQVELFDVERSRLLYDLEQL